MLTSTVTIVVVSIVAVTGMRLLDFGAVRAIADRVPLTVPAPLLAC